MGSAILYLLEAIIGGLPPGGPNDPDLIYLMHREDHDILNDLGEPIAHAKTKIVADVIVDAMNAVAI